MGLQQLDLVSGWVPRLANELFALMLGGERRWSGTRITRFVRGEERWICRRLGGMGLNIGSAAPPIHSSRERRAPASDPWRRQPLDRRSPQLVYRVRGLWGRVCKRNKKQKAPHSRQSIAETCGFETGLPCELMHRRDMLTGCCWSATYRTARFAAEVAASWLPAAWVVLHCNPNPN